jgi:hypothetical protein
VEQALLLGRQLRQRLVALRAGQADVRTRRVGGQHRALIGLGRVQHGAMARRVVAGGALRAREECRLVGEPRQPIVDARLLVALEELHGEHRAGARGHEILEQRGRAREPERMAVVLADEHGLRSGGARDEIGPRHARAGRAIPGGDAARIGFDELRRHDGRGREVGGGGLAGSRASGEDEDRGRQGATRGRRDPDDVHE